MRQEFTQELKNIYHKNMMDVHTVVPGKILSFDPEKQEAKIRPTAKYRLPDDSLRDFPDINHVPVFFPQGIGQTATIVWRVQGGDECFLFFSEQALDYWRTGAESDTDLRFDLTNAFAFVGLHPRPNPLTKRAYDNESIIVQRGCGEKPEQTFVEIYDGKMEMQVQYSGNGTDTYHLMADGRENTLEFTVRALGGPETVELKIDGDTGDIDLRTKGKLEVHSEGEMHISSDTSININAPRIDLNDRFRGG